MAEIELNVRCAACGKRETIKIVNREIPENWAYFGRIDVNACATSEYFFTPKDPNRSLIDTVKIPNPFYNPKAKHVYVEYWECKECVGKGERENETLPDKIMGEKEKG